MQAGQRTSGVLRLGSRTFGPSDLVIMAIINRTPDSFYDKGATYDDDAALAAVDRAVARRRGHRRHRRREGGAGRRGRSRPRRCDRVVPFVAAVRAAPSRRRDQRRHLARRGGRRVPRGRRRRASTTPGAASTRRSRRAAGAAGAGIVCTHAGGLPPRTRPHRVGVRRRGRRRRSRRTSGWPSGRWPPASARRGADRPRPRLRQEHLPLARGDPAAAASWSHRLAGARVAVQQGLRRRDARPAGGRTARRHAGGDRRSRLAGRAGVPRAQRARATRRVLDMVASDPRRPRHRAVARRGLA